MEICPGISVRIPLRFCQIPRKISQFSFCPHVVASTNLSFDPETLRSESQKRMFILGMGYVGQFFANQLKKQGWFVSGTCTSIVKKEKLDQMGFDAFVFDATNEPLPEVLDVLNYHTHLLVSIPPVLGIGDPMLQYGELLKSRLKDGNLQWLCYLSSTSVYGDCGGAWVDENYPITPETELAKARLAAEEGWLNLGSNLRLAAQVFRLGVLLTPYLSSSLCQMFRE